jgi:hypothetical protein
VLGWWNNKRWEAVGPRLRSLFKRPYEETPPAAASREDLDAGAGDDIEAALHMLTAHLGEPFKLPQLLELAEHRGLSRPHSSINRLLLKGVIVGGSDGLFRWAKPDGSGKPQPSGRASR